MKRKTKPLGVVSAPVLSKRKHEETCAVCGEEDTKSTLLNLGCACVQHLCIGCYHSWRNSRYKKLSYPFDNLSELKEERTESCPSCRSDDYMLDKIKLVFPPETPVCPVCDEVFDSLEDLNKHVQVAHVLTVVCPYCKEVCEDDYAFEEHIFKDCHRLTCSHCNRMGTYADLLVHSTPVLASVGYNKNHCSSEYCSEQELGGMLMVKNRMGTVLEHSSKLFHMYASAVQFSTSGTIMPENLSELAMYTFLYLLSRVRKLKFERMVEKANKHVDDWQRWVTRQIQKLLSGLHPSFPSPAYFCVGLRSLCIIVSNEYWMRKGLDAIVTRYLVKKKVRRNLKVERLAMNTAVHMEQDEGRNPLTVTKQLTGRDLLSNVRDQNTRNILVLLDGLFS